MNACPACLSAKQQRPDFGEPACRASSGSGRQAGAKEPSLPLTAPCAPAASAPGPCSLHAQMVPQPLFRSARSLSFTLSGHPHCCIPCRSPTCSFCRCLLSYSASPVGPSSPTFGTDADNRPARRCPPACSRTSSSRAWTTARESLAVCRLRSQSPSRHAGPSRSAHPEPAVRPAQASHAWLSSAVRPMPALSSLPQNPPRPSDRTDGPLPAFGKAPSCLGNSGRQSLAGLSRSGRAWSLSRPFQALPPRPLEKLTRQIREGRPHPPLSPIFLHASVSRHAWLLRHEVIMFDAVSSPRARSDAGLDGMVVLPASPCSPSSVGCRPEPPLRLCRDHARPARRCRNGSSAPERPSSLPGRAACGTPHHCGPCLQAALFFAPLPMTGLLFAAALVSPIGRSLARIILRHRPGQRL